MAALSGFYKNDEEAGLLYAPNFVDGPGFSLRADSDEDRARTVDGWQWFESQTAAKAAHSLT